MNAFQEGVAETEGVKGGRGGKDTRKNGSAMSGLSLVSDGGSN